LLTYLQHQHKIHIRTHLLGLVVKTTYSVKHRHCTCVFCGTTVRPLITLLINDQHKICFNKSPSSVSPLSPAIDKTSRNMVTLRSHRRRSWVSIGVYREAVSSPMNIEFKLELSLSSRQVQSDRRTFVG